MAGNDISVMLTLFVFLLAPTDVSGHLLDTKTATYILAGIAGLYILITCCCFFLTICICYKARRKHTGEYMEYAHGEELGDVLSPMASSHLSPIYEGPELESPVTMNEPRDTLFENIHIEDFGAYERCPTIVTGSDKKQSIFVNKLAWDTDLVKKEHELNFQHSPLGGHTPERLTHPIKVSYSDDVSDSESDTAPVTQVSVLSWSESSSIRQMDKQHSNNSEMELESCTPAKRIQAGRKTTGQKRETPSISNNETEGQLRMRKLDSASNANEGRKKLVPFLKNEQTLTGNNKTVTLSKLYSELSSIAAKWYFLGIQLKVSNKTLNAIRLINKGDNDVCMMRVCEEWLMQQKKSNKVPDWTTIIGVLRSRVIFETALADLLHQKYCSDEVEVDSNEEGGPTSKFFTWID